MASVVEIMAGAAQAAGCDHIPFSQETDLVSKMRSEGGLDGAGFGANGICHGLAVTWMEHVRKGGEDADFIRNAVNWKDSPIAARSHLIYRNQKNIAQWSKLTGFKTAMDEDGKEKIREYDLTEAEMKLFTAWTSAAIGTRYFVADVKKHSMAAVGSIAGKVRFFDPNGGIVSARSAAAVGRCLYSFFSDEKIKKHYSGAGAFLSVQKFKT